MKFTLSIGKLAFAWGIVIAVLANGNIPMSMLGGLLIAIGAIYGWGKT